MPSNRFSFSLVTTLISSLLALSGCASLNQSECLTANWQTIGFEDGAKGRLPAQIGEHRKACAKYGISPNLSAYQQGHENGLHQYCTERTGFNRGQNGATYNGACPKNLEAAFLTGYHKGRELHELKQIIRQNKSTISNHERELESLHHQIETKEKRVISSATSERERAALLHEIKELHHRQADLEIELSVLDQEKRQHEGQYNTLFQQYAR